MLPAASFTGLSRTNTWQRPSATRRPHQRPDPAPMGAAGTLPAPSTKLGPVGAAAWSGQRSCCGHHGVSDAGAGPSPGLLQEEEILLPAWCRARGLLPGQGPSVSSTGQAMWHSGRLPATKGLGKIPCQRGTALRPHRRLSPSPAPPQASARGAPAASPPRVRSTLRHQRLKQSEVSFCAAPFPGEAGVMPRGVSARVSLNHPRPGCPRASCFQTSARGLCGSCITLYASAIGVFLPLNPPPRTAQPHVTSQKAIF